MSAQGSAASGAASGPGRADTFVPSEGENDRIVVFNPGEGDTTVGP